MSAPLRVARVGTARVAAQAKINLFLRILAREESGYHSLETLFQRIDLADDVVVRVGGAIRSLDCAGPAMPSGGLGATESNLAFRAAESYAAATGWPSGFQIEIEKRIPVGGGLGGGSADAGAVLRALDALSPNRLGEARLIELATPLGADVPFLTSSNALSLAWGRGERLLALPPLEARDIVLVIPQFAVPTAEAYAWLASSRGAYAPRGTAVALESLGAWPTIAALAHNDFEAVIAARQPSVASIAEDLAARGASIAMLSGSGSAVFGVFAEPPRTHSSGAAREILTRSAAKVFDVELSA